MNRYKYILLSVLLTLTMVSCSANTGTSQKTREYIAMDTLFTVHTGDLSPDGTADSARNIDDIFDECEDLTKDIENVLSATLNGAEVNSFNGEIDVMFDADPMLCDVLSTALNISSLTGGAYDPALGALTTLWNVKGGGPVPTAESITSALAVSGSGRITLEDDIIKKSDSRVKLDLGGIGKGFAAQKLAEMLYESGVSYGIVSAGRTVGVFGDKPDGTPFKIGIADPFNSDGVVGYIYTESGFVSVAGDYEQYFVENGVKYHHIIDPKTGYPANSGLSSVAVLAQNGAAADALSTALLVMGYDGGIELYRSGEIPFEAVFIFSDGSVKLTEGLGDDRFVMNSDYNPDNAVDSVVATKGQTDNE